MVSSSGLTEIKLQVLSDPVITKLQHVEKKPDKKTFRKKTVVVNMSKKMPLLLQIDTPKSSQNLLTIDEEK
jgi:hypothetical protein